MTLSTCIQPSINSGGSGGSITSSRIPVPGAVMDPRVSFVVPSYNYGRFVRHAIDSLLCQTERSIEIIVIDDCSTDDTSSVLAQYAADARVTVIRHSRNQGHIHTYNEGLALARGEFIGLLAA